MADEVKRRKERVVLTAAALPIHLVLGYSVFLSLHQGLWKACRSARYVVADMETFETFPDQVDDVR